MDTAFTPTRLRLARQRRGLTTRKLALSIDIPERNLSHYENGSAVPRKTSSSDLPVLSMSRSASSYRTMLRRSLSRPCLSVR